MDLNEEQKNVVKSWIAEGDSLSDVQKKLSSELGISMTYMDLRLLVLDLGVGLKDRQVEKKKEPVVPEDDFEQTQDGGLRVEVDRITRAGSIVSGSVVFSDGVKATWALDQMGRLVLDAGTPDYRPRDEDIQSFQEELKKALATRGF